MHVSNIANAYRAYFSSTATPKMRLQLDIQQVLKHNVLLKCVSNKLEQEYHYRDKSIKIVTSLIDLSFTIYYELHKF